MFAVSVRRALLALSTTAAVCGAAAVAPAAAEADSGCPGTDLSQPFAQWGDQASYALVPGGDFEDAGWSLARGAQIVPDSEPYGVTGTVGSSSLSLPAGAWADSPAVCVDENDPTMRFVVGGTGTVLVRVVYAGRQIPVGVAKAGGTWSPSPIMWTASQLFAGNRTAQVTLRFSQLTGNPQVDDVFIDPWNRG